MAEKIKILLAEDDRNLGFVIKDNLETHQYLVDLFTDGESALQAFGKNDYDLCIFDVMLPRKDGFSLTQDIRKINQDIPIVFLTAKSLKEDRIKGFKIGGDDYITKPFSIEELILRLEVILKRVNKQNRTTTQEMYEIGNYEFDFKNQQLMLNGKSQDMTIKEAELLRLFCQNLNQVVERNTILNLVWKDNSYFTGRSMDVFISRLRKYLSGDAAIEIVNIHSVGYKLIVKK